MEDKCPICYKHFPTRVLERHVNTCLDSQETDVVEIPAEKAPESVFSALGLKADKSSSRRSPEARNRAKEKPTLTSILLAERSLKRKQQQLAGGAKKKARETTDLASSPAETVVLYETSQELKREGKEDEKDTLEAEVSEISPQMVSGGPADENGASHTVPHTKLADSLRSTEFPQKSPKASQNGPGSSLKAQKHVNATETAAEPRLSQALSRNQEAARFKREAALPLAQRLRPRTLTDFHGQEKLVGENGLLRNIINTDQIPSFILWGVPGVGKTSLARIIASTSSYKFMEVSGADGNAKKLKEAFSQAENERRLTGRKTILFLDEIHRFNKAVQDLLLPVIEKGVVSVIGATTENPSFTLNNALLSRMHTFVMEPLPHDALVKIINRGLWLVNKTRQMVHHLHLIALHKDAVDYIANLSTGDLRVALNILESVNAYLSGVKYQIFTKYEDAERDIDIPDNLGVIKINVANLKPLLSTRNYHQMYDKQGESHYDTISAFHKSIRGSDADAAMFYLVKMLSGGEDPLYIARRMIVIASEDVGLRDSLCLPFATSVLEALQFVGMPEGEIILGHCVVKLARAPKSTKAYRALRSAQALLKEKPELTKVPIPMHLRNAPTGLMKELGYGESYKYNPDYQYGKVKQGFFHEDARGLKFVEPQHLGTAKDSEVSDTEYSKLEEEQNSYLEFKKQRRDKKKRAHEARKERKIRIKDSANDKELGDSPRDGTDEDVHDLYSYDEYLDRNQATDGVQHNFGYSYDENQPASYLDDPDQTKGEYPITYAMEQ